MSVYISGLSLGLSIIALVLGIVANRDLARRNRILSEQVKALRAIVASLRK